MPRKRQSSAPRTNPNPWRVRPLPRWSAVLAPIIVNAFQDLRISVALYTKEEGVPEEWYPIHVAPSVTSFEFASGAVSRRYPYNYRMFEQVRRKRGPMLGSHAGFHDLFVPVGDDSELWGILAVGPFALSRPTSAELHERWRALSGARGRLTDASFRDYVSSSLSTLTLEGPHYQAFERLMVCFANLVGGQGNPGALADEAAALRIRLIETRFAERMWEAARAMLDQRTSRAWPHHSHATLALLAMKQVPRHVAVGLLLGRNDDVDPVDDLLRRDAFQRACVVMARKRGGFAFERMGDHGVALLLDHAGSESSARARLVESANQLAALARRFGLRMHTGVGPVGDATLLPERYDAALAAAERALAEGKAMVHADRRPERGAREIRKLRRDLGKSVGSHSSLLSPRFDRYIEAALVHCRYRYDQVRAELAAGVERLAEPLLATGALDEKSFEEMCAAMDDPSESAPTVAALIARYKLLVSDLEKALEQPSLAGRDRGIRRAIAFVREHASEPLGLAQVARVAGFAPGYFSKLFKRDEGVTFERYLRALRVERARQMLHATRLSVERVRQLAGFRTRSYFNRVFRQSFGTTPVAYRERALPPRKL